MFYVYLLRSQSNPRKTYVGITNNLKKRLQQHNTPGVHRHTAHFMPWEIICFIGFKSKRKAELFEHYLTSGSGWEFARRRFW